MHVLGIGRLLKSQRLVIQITHRCAGNNPKEWFRRRTDFGLRSLRVQ